MKKSKTIIIGAGAAGLMAARELKSRGNEFIILESTDLIGGRAQTHKTNPQIEYGPEYLHGSTPLTDSLLEEYEIPYYDLSFDYHFYLDGKLRPMPDFWERICSVMGNLKPLKHDLNFLEYLDKYEHLSKPDLELAKGFVQGFDAADLNQVSTKALQDMKGQFCDPRLRKLRRPLQGYGVLMHKLAEEVFTHIRFEYQVGSVEWKKGSVIVKGFSGKTKIPFELKADKVLDTVSIAVLKQQHITPTPNALNKFLEQVEMGQVVKMVGEFVPEFFHHFEDLRFPFIASPELNFTAWWPPTPIHIPIITAWSGGEKARGLSEMNEDQLKEIFIAELGLITSISVSKIERLLKVIHHHDWNHDPSFLGAYSFPKVHEGKTVKPETVFEDTLYFAGEAFHAEMSGTIEGALMTGKAMGQLMAS